MTEDTRKLVKDPCDGRDLWHPSSVVCPVEKSAIYEIEDYNNLWKQKFLHTSTNNRISIYARNETVRDDPFQIVNPAKGWGIELKIRAEDKLHVDRRYFLSWDETIASPKSGSDTFQALEIWSGYDVWFREYSRPFTRSFRVLQLALSFNGRLRENKSLARRRWLDQEVFDASDQSRDTLRISTIAFP